MRLSMQDKNEFLKAAVKAPDLESLRLWVVSVVDAIDALPDGKADSPVPVPPFILPAGSGHAANGAAPRHWEETLLT
jgi:hypothetical protein